MTEPIIAFAVPDHETPAIEVLVNFGLFAGRDATRAEIDRLAARLLPYVGEVSIVGEDRHEFDAVVEASVHIVRIEIPGDQVDGDASALERRVVVHAEAWARDCISDRSLGP
jgi:hypothetical protein